MPEIKVTDEQGTVHVFPDGSTPDMIAKALKVKPPAATGGHSLDKPESSTLAKVGRGAALGAFEGLGVAPATTPGGVISGTAGQFKEGLKTLVSDTYKANSGFPPELRGVATIIDLIPHFIDKTATSLETGGRESIAAARRGDYEEAAEKGASTLTSAALLRSGKPAVEAESGLSKVGQLRAKVQPFARKVTGVEPAARDAVTKAAEKQGVALEENKVARTEQVKKNLEQQRASETDIAREKIAVAEKNRGIEATNKAQEGPVAERAKLAKTVDEQSNQLGKHLDKVEASVGKEANKKFDAVRSQIGNPETDPENLIGVVKGVEKNILQDIPENIKEFRAIISHGGEAPEGLATAFKEVTGEDPLGPEPITWDKLQSIKSRIDARLRKSRGMNGDLKRALYQTRDAVIDEMGTMAEENGAGESWADARNFWRQYKEDFHEPTGPSGSGSPIAQSLDAVDPKNIRQPFLRTQAATGNRAIEILRKYPQHGGTEAAAHAEELLRNHGTMLALPEKVRPKPLAVAPEVHQMPTSKPAPEPPAAPVVDVNKVARDAIATRAKNWGSFNARDIGILTASSIGGLLEHILSGRGGYELPIASVTYEGGKYAASRLLNKPSVVDWLAKTPPQEIEALSKIPGSDRVKIVDGLTQAAVESKATRLSPEVRRFLGPANVARILAVSSANQIRTPGQARDRLRQLAPASN